MAEVHVLDSYYLAITLLITVAYQLLFFSIAFSFKFDKLTGQRTLFRPRFSIAEQFQTSPEELISLASPSSPSHSPATTMLAKSSLPSSSWSGELGSLASCSSESSRRERMTASTTR